MATRHAAEDTPLWLADWTDAEHATFMRTVKEARIPAEVLRYRALGTSSGTAWHRLRSYPTYAQLAFGGLTRAGGPPLIAWQPLAGVIAALLELRRTRRIVIVGPRLDEAPAPLRRAMVAAMRRAGTTTTVFSSAAAAPLVEAGVPRDKVHHVRYGTRPRRAEPPGAPRFLLALGKERRDWTTLARAAQGLGWPVKVVGPHTLPVDGPLELVRTRSREETFALMEGAGAVVIPLTDASRQAGHLSMLDAFSAGRPVITTRGAGTTDYVTPDRGILVPVGDPDALRDAMTRAMDPDVSARLSRGALTAAATELSLAGFIAATTKLALCP